MGYIHPTGESELATLASDCGFEVVGATMSQDDALAPHAVLIPEQG